MDFYKTAEKNIQRNFHGPGKFKKYKTTKEYSLALEQEMNKLIKQFNSKRNSRILSLIESGNVPDINCLMDKTVEYIISLLKTNDIGIRQYQNTFSSNIVLLSDFQLSDILNIFENKILLDELFIVYACNHRIDAYKTAKKYIKNLWIEEYKKLNPFKKCDKTLMIKSGEIITIDEALRLRYIDCRYPIESLLSSHLNNSVICSAIFSNNKYSYLKDAAARRDELKRIIMEKTPSDWSSFYPEARTINRHFILHIGPTNSGKTYQAIDDLMRADSGVYLAPLRLLALENQEKLNSNGVPCSLYTGEEQIIINGSKHTSSTIETLSLNAKYDVAVIDEAQLIGDEQRGWAWTQAILGVKANTIHVCMSEDAEQIVKKLIKSCNDSYEIIRHERNTPLVVEDKSFVFPKDVNDGDAIIVFSRRSVWDAAAELAKRNIKASVIYGSLPPSVRREEVRKFIDGETSVVVATDAIGMGINLPIKRVVFLEKEKFDGKTRRSLLHSEYKQIAGRAGRYGMFDTGYVSTSSNPKILKANMTKKYEFIKNINVPFPESLLSLDFPLIDILRMWQNIPDTDIFHKTDINKEIFLCEVLSKNDIKLSKKEILERIQVPFNYEDEDLLSVWLRAIKENVVETFDVNTFYIPEGNVFDTIQDLEHKYKVCDLIFAMARIFGCSENDLNKIMQSKKCLSDRIIEKLKENKKGKGRTCKCCGKSLPFGYPYGYCESCYYDLNDWY